jgi:hypothetical protein
MGVVVVSVAALLWVWAIGDVLAMDDQHLQPGEKGAWVATVILLPAAGALAWLLAGRHATQARTTADRPAEIEGCPSVPRARLRGWGTTWVVPDHRCRGEKGRENL